MAGPHRVVRLSPSDRRLIGRASAIYLESLPRSERKAASFLREAAQRPEYVLQAMLSGSTVLGFAATYLSKQEPIALLEYLAVDGRMRGEGAGTRLLRAVRTLCRGRVIIIEVDQPSGDDVQVTGSEARCRFYRRGGWLCVSGFVYYMPRIGPDVPPPMCLMIHGFASNILPLSVLRGWLADIYRNVYDVPDADVVLDELMRFSPKSLTLE